MTDEEAQVTRTDPELERYRRTLSSKKFDIPYLNDIRKEIITSYKSENVVELMEKYIW